MPTSRPEKQFIFTEKSGSTANCHELRMHTLGTTLNCSWCAIGQYLPSFIALTNDVYALSKLTVSIFTWLRMPQKSEHFKCS